MKVSYEMSVLKDLLVNALVIIAAITCLVGQRWIKNYLLQPRKPASAELIRGDSNEIVAMCIVVVVLLVGHSRAIYALWPRD